MELARAMLFDSGLPMYLWDEATNHMAWIANRAPTRSLGGKTPYEAKYKSKPNMSGVVPFGTRAWVKIVNAGKLEPRARLGYFVGFDNNSTGYRIYFPERRIVRVEREVTFDTTPRDAIEIPIDEIPVLSNNPIARKEVDGNAGGEEARDIEIQGEQRREVDIEDEAVENGMDEGHAEEEEQQEGRVMRTRGANTQPGHYWNLAGRPRRAHANLMQSVQDTLFALSSALETAPQTIQEAIAGPHANEWKEAWKAEIEQLINIGTWELVPRPKDKPVIPCREVLHEKHGPDGKVIRRKVRVAAGGHRQVEGINYTDTFASAAKIATIRIVLALAAKWDWEIDQVDVVAAFLNGKLKEEVYMEAPYGVLTKNDVGKVCRLDRTLYGLKQAGNEWYKEMLGVFKRMGFKVYLCDSSLFLRFNDKGSMMIPVCTDDMTVAGSSRKVVDDFKAELATYFKLTDKGEIHWLLGFEIVHDRKAKTISLNQRAYIEAMAKKFGQENARPAYTPLQPGTVLTKANPNASINSPYREACGHILWPAVTTRPDIQFAAGLIAQFMDNPSEEHWRAVTNIIRYLNTMKDYCLVLGGEGEVGIGYVDADFAAQEYRHSISGYSFHIGQGV